MTQHFTFFIVNINDGIKAVKKIEIDSSVQNQNTHNCN